MALTSGYFNSVDGDRKYNAEQMTMYFKGLVSDGIFENVENKFVVKADGSGMTATVGTGRGLLLTHWVENNSPYEISFDASDVQYNRWDRVVLHCDLSVSSRAITIVVKKGTPAANPAKPSLDETTDTVKELLLADVYIPKNSTVVTQSKILDWRGSSFCPWITGLIEQVDTDTLFLQYQAIMEEMTNDLTTYFAEKKAEFDNWYSSLTETLGITTKLNKYQWSTTATDAASITPDFGSKTYEDGDLLLVHVGGVLFIEGTEFTWSSGKIVFTTALKGEQTITAILVKSEIG